MNINEWFTISFVGGFFLLSSSFYLFLKETDRREYKESPFYLFMSLVIVVISALGMLDKLHFK